MANRKLLPQSEPRLSGTLSVLLTDSATTATFSNPPDAAELPTYFMIEPDSDDNREKVRAVDVSGSVVTIERGVDNGGVGVEHQANSTYKQTFTAQHWDKVVEALENGWLSEDAGLTITKVDADTLRIAGYDRTAYYPVGRVLLINGTVKCKVVAAAYGGGNTDIDISGGTVPTTITSLKLLIGPVENPLVGVNEIPRYGEDAEASDTYVITLDPAPSAYFNGMVVNFKANTANTGPCTLNVNGLGAKDIKTPEGADPESAQIPAGSIVILVYDGTNFILQSIGGLTPKSYVDLRNNSPDGFLINGKIVPSVASNNLTVAIKGMDGNDPSASNPVYVRIGDTIRSITSALSVSLNAGTNWFGSGTSDFAAIERDYFVYLGYNTTDGVVIGVCLSPNVGIYSQFSTTPTSGDYGAISTTTNAAAGDNYVNIGRFAATLSTGAGYTWTVPTFTNINLIQRQCFTSRWLSWAPAISYGGGSVNPTSLTVDEAQYQINERTVSFNIKASVVKGSSNRQYISFSPPRTISHITISASFGGETLVQANFLPRACYTENTNKLTIYLGAVIARDGFCSIGGSFRH